MDALGGRRVWVAGHRGLVGRALMRRLARADCVVLTTGRARLDFRRQTDVEDFIAAHRPDAIIIAAATVGGIGANAAYPVDFLYDNLMIAANIIHAAHAADIDRLLYLGSSCIYPKHAANPIAETALLTGPLEPTNQWYAVAKIAGLKLVEAYHRHHGRAYVAAMPTNLYGPGDTFHPENGHVLPSLILKAHRATVAGEKTLTIWGSGTPRREFLHVDDCADALVFLLEHYGGPDPINIGSGSDVAILDLARTVCAIVGFEGAIATDPSRPDGTPRKLLDSGRLRAMGWSPRIALEDGIAQTYRWYIDHVAQPARV